MKNQLRVLLTFAVAGAIGGDLVAASRATVQVANPVLNELLQKGVPFGMNFRTLPALTMPDGLNQAGQKQVVQKVLDLKAGKKVNYAEFTANNLNGPYVLLIDAPLPNPQPGHSVDLWFVVWGNLAKITAPAFLKKQFQLDQNDHIDVLKPADLPMGIQPPQQPAGGGGDWYAHGVFTLISNDKRVLVEGTAHTVETVTNESGTMAGIIDQRFNQDPKLPNQWRSILRDANGRVLPGPNNQPQLGPPTPYDSAGGYIKVTKLVQPAGALFVEYHLVYDEPQGWFNGRDLLRAKLRIKTEGDVRSFRKQVLEANQ